MIAEKIISALAGSSSTMTMTFDDLVKSSGFSQAFLQQVLAQMLRLHPMPINSATITRDGKTQDVYWLTGVIDKAERQHITINHKKAVEAGYSGSRKPPRRDEVKPNTANVQPIVVQNAVHEPDEKIHKSVVTTEQPNCDEEKTMTTTQAISKGLGKIITAIVMQAPGISVDELHRKVTEQVPSIEVKKIIDMSYYLSTCNHKTIKRVGAGMKSTYYPLSADVVTKPKENPVTLVVETIANPVVTVAQPTDSSKKFDLLLSDDDCLHIFLDEEKFMLDAAQVARLDHFLSRVERIAPGKAA